MAFDGSTIANATTGTFGFSNFSDTFTVGFADVDMVALDLTAGRLYVADIDNGGDFLLRIFDALGNEVFLNDDGLRSTDDVVSPFSPYGEFTANYTGRYYFAVSPYYMADYNPFSTSGRVSPENPLPNFAGILTVSETGTNFFPSSGSINAITPESANDETDALSDRGSTRVRYAGAVDSSNDVDMARFELAKSSIVVVDVNGTLGNGTVLRIFDDGGVQIGIDDDSGAGEDPELVFVAPVFDDYYIAISGEGNSTYSGLDGTGTVPGTIGGFEVIIHVNPTLIGSSAAQATTGTDGNDYIVALAGNDTVNGGLGNDTLAGGDDNDQISGSTGLDILYGEGGDDTLNGGTGNDVVSGGLGLDSLTGFAGNDLLQGDAGNDTLNGGTGNDTLHGDDGDDTLSGTGGNDQLFGGSGLDNLNGGVGADTLSGGLGNDTLFGATGNDTLTGDNDNDTLLGAAGLDTLSGGIGTDTLLGGIDADQLEGGGGDDQLTGGGGADTFVFLNLTNGIDTILDFTLAEDVIDLSAIFDTTGAVVDAGNLGFFVQVTTFGVSGALLAIDADGSTGGLSYTAIAVVNNTTPAQLFDISNFLV